MSKLATPAVIGVSAVLGAGLAVGVGALGVGGSDGTTTTVVQQAPLSASAPGASDDKDAEALTARAIYERDAPGVVQVLADVRQQSDSPFGFPQQQQGQSSGSGFVIDDAGTILTNEHVIDGATAVRVAFGQEKVVDAEIVGKDASTDVAVLRVDPKQAGTLRPLPLGSAEKLQVGDPVVAIGNPFGLDRTLTTGVVSAKQRQLQAPNGWAIRDVIQTDASINPGNSGGPLIDGGGRVVGINSQIATGGSGSGSVGIGFAVPIDTVKRILPDLKRTGRANTPYLGVTSVDVPEKGELPSELSLPDVKGAWIQSVTPGSPAAKAGIRGGRITLSTSEGPIQIGGDVITKVDGTAVRGSEDVGAAIADRKAGDEVTVELRRGDEKKTVKVKLERRPDDARPDGSGGGSGGLGTTP